MDIGLLWQITPVPIQSTTFMGYGAFLEKVKRNNIGGCGIIFLHLT